MTAVAVHKDPGSAQGARVEIHNLNKSFIGKKGTELKVVDDLTLTVEPGEFVSLVGPSGCGKSTVLNVLGRLDTDYDGRAEVIGRNRSDRAIVFQDPRLLPWRTLRQNVEFGLEARGVPRREWKAKVDHYLERVGLGEFGQRYPHQLSGGMQQRAALARALVVDASIILMDEPFSGLDEFTARSLRELLSGLVIEEGKTVVFVTHNVFEATLLSDRIVLFTPRPARIHMQLKVTLPRPRDYDDPRLFTASSAVTREILKLMH